MASTHEVYAEPAELAKRLGIPNADADRLALAVLNASRYVDMRLGTITKADLVDVSLPLTLNLVPAPVQLHEGTLFVAARLYSSTDVPRGTAGMSDMATTVYSLSVPELDLILVGMGESWGVA